jgi:hypothetical protein
VILDPNWFQQNDVSGSSVRLIRTIKRIFVIGIEIKKSFEILYIRNFGNIDQHTFGFETYNVWSKNIIEEIISGICKFRGSVWLILVHICRPGRRQLLVGVVAGYNIPGGYLRPSNFAEVTSACRGGNRCMILFCIEVSLDNKTVDGFDG